MCARARPQLLQIVRPPQLTDMVNQDPNFPLPPASSARPLCAVLNAWVVYDNASALYAAHDVSVSRYVAGHLPVFALFHCRDHLSACSSLLRVPHLVLHDEGLPYLMYMSCPCTYTHHGTSG